METKSLRYSLIDAAALQRLTDDILSASSSRGDASTFAAAPILDEYAYVAQSSLALTGIVTGHPRILDGDRCMTTQVFYLDVELGLARTVNRWYRLGRPHGSEGRRNA